MQHLILTRLAVGTPSTKWLAFRLRLFERYCAPSVRAQTNQKFKWLLVVHPKTPSWFLNRALASSTNAFFVFEGSGRLWPNWPRLVTPFTGTGRLLTSRLDSDDMLHMSFVHEVQRYAARAHGPLVIDFSEGLRLRYPDLACRAISTKLPTHFISLVEDGRNTVYCAEHKRINQMFWVLSLKTEPMWVEVCHNMNVVNTFSKRGQFIPWNSVKSFFRVPQKSGVGAAIAESGSRNEDGRVIVRTATPRLCPVCGMKSEALFPCGGLSGPGLMCPSCRSLEHDRLGWMFLCRQTNLLAPCRKNLLHVAPEPSLEKRFRAIPSVTYSSAAPSNRGIVIHGDIPKKRLPRGVFDVIICGPDFETTCDDRGVISEVRRLLAPSGWAVFIVPGPPAERRADVTTRGLGGVRRVFTRSHDEGPDFERRLRKCGFKLRRIHPYEFVSESELRTMAINVGDRIFLCIR